MEDTYYMSFTLKIEKNPYDDRILFKKKEFTLEPGFTVLCGCNGSGKTTLINMLETTLKKDKKTFIKFNGLERSGSNLISNSLFHNDMDLLAGAMLSSEGERLHLSIGEFCKEIGYTIRKSDVKEIFILCDAIDSGLSIDQVLDVKDFLTIFLPGEVPDKELYIITSCNQYEMAANERCIDITELKPLKLTTYNSYKRFIMKSREKKNKLIEKASN